MGLSGDDDNDDKIGEPPGDPSESSPRRVFTRDWTVGLDKHKEAIEASKDVLEQIRKIVGSREEDPDMTKKLERLEAQFDALNESVTSIRVSIGKIDTRLDGIERNLVSKGQAAAWALVAGIAVFSAGWWVVQQYLTPLIANLPK